MDPHHLQTFFGYPSVKEPTLDPNTQYPCFNTSNHSEDSGSSLLKEENLRKLQEQFLPQNYRKPSAKNIISTNDQYPALLKRRGCILVPTVEKRRPSNCETITKALEVTREEQTPPQSYAMTWDLTRNTNSKAGVTFVFTAKVLDYEILCQTGRDVRSNLAGQWRYGHPLPSGGSTLQIAAPNPDMTIGYNRDEITGCDEAIEYLGEYCTPIKGDGLLAFPVATAEIKHITGDAYAERQNMHNAAIMLRNLRKLRQLAGMEEEELRTKFDGIAHVITISFTQTTSAIYCCWSAVAEDGQLQFFSKPIAFSWTNNGVEPFRVMVHKIRNAVDWVMEANKQWIRDDMAKLQGRLNTLDPLMPDLSASTASIGSEMTD
ncbi:hypothetical protein A1F94_003087 [Pyrenophora tritici-repentis]|uniref:DUF7924 domain-containing protein n=2 Tax=Pyrenophora tritici-repentis TaxID=45151 RepID=A0A2W1HY60_9PLEO|nr:uncharacterized protein PTRG_02931 [Pyrenophora tritici-repentis Pt-1C-BFP]KAA8622993.1 hypothetical protein PtrV1_04299 [Pyrenophora tritici-repentis]EDU45454.1 predicted protein [Pyrenophora tritici-repentis Pt-1C-BFP]KAF7451981.1 hypothetical protein A1F99_037580 [Pyrenophora tritici-repentis]KAF7574897.1 hypothetical protein PtrM4_065210 [Pyrenophora tritici-repentis]KAG9386337.1 hypothetical protein A1F94_003087 [Pyrenophora tritici-repentis]